MSERIIRCYYCEEMSGCNELGLYEGSGGYKKDDTRFRIICANCYPQINRQGGRSWELAFKTDIDIQPAFINKIIKFIIEEDEEGDGRNLKLIN